MFQYEDLMWLISFPLVCAVMLWFSLDLAVLVRVGGGRRRRANARRAIERLILNSPVCAATSVVQSPTSLATATHATATSPDHHSHPRRTPATPQDWMTQGVSDINGSSVQGEGATPQTESTPSTPHARPPYQKVRQVAVPAALRVATRAVVRRAVVMVGGDFARSPRMQYHAASLARSGLFDEVLLVGLECGNQLSEDLLISGEPQPERFVTREGTTRGMEHAVYDVQERLNAPEVHAGHGCIISTRYLSRAPTPPEWLQAVFPLRSLHWVVCTIYRVAALTLLFVMQTGRVTATRINEHGQLLVTDLVMLQTPPAVPFVLLVKYIVCPLAFVYNVLLYYCVVVPAAWMNPDAMRDMRRECRLQSLRFQPTTNEPAKSRAAKRHGVNAASSPLSGSSTAASSGAVLAPACSRIRPWVFYPAIVVDWHNYGYTILDQNQRPTTAVQLYKLLEVHLCAGNVNVTVSKAMQHSLEHFYPRLSRTALATPSTSPPPLSLPSALQSCYANGGARTSPTNPPTSAVTVLYDVAPSFFRPVSRRRCVHEVLDRLLLRRRSTSPTSPAANASAYTLVGMSELENMGWGIAGPPAWVYADAAAELPASPQGSPASPAAPSSAFAPSAASVAGAAAPRRGVIMVGSTSWTEEDDYSVLIRALRRLDHRLNHEVTTLRGGSINGSVMASVNVAPLDLWVLITGKGPARKRFEEAVRVAKLSAHVVVSTYYAQSFQEYSVLLGAADVGFCLHYSSSGLDLPMKGVDMVGAGLPVIALQYPAIDELMGGATRVLAQTRAVAHGASSSSGSVRKMSAPAALVECERGWVFRDDTDLEVLLSSFVGLPASATASALLDRGGRVATTLAPTPLAIMKRKAQEARRHAPTWSENWTRVLLPVLKQVV